MAKFKDPNTGEVIEVGSPELNPDLIKGKISVPDTTTLGTITPASLQPATPIQLPPQPQDTTNYNALVAGGQSYLDTQNKNLGIGQEVKPKDAITTRIEQLAGLTPPSLTEAYKTAYGQSGIDQLNQEKMAQEVTLKQAKDKYANVSARLTALNQQATVTPVQVGEEFKGRASVGQQSAITNQRNREIAIEALPLQAEALLAQGEVASAQGNVDLAQENIKLAQDKLNTVFKIQTEDTTNQYNYKKDLIDKVYDFASADQKTKLDALKIEEDRKYKEQVDAVNNAQTISMEAMRAGQPDIAAQITKLDPKSPTYRQELAGLQAQIKEDTLDRTYKQLQIQKMQQDLIGVSGGVSSMGTGENLYNQLKTRNINFKELPADQKKLAIAEFGKRGENIPRSLGAKEIEASQDAITGLDAVRQLKTMASSGKLPLAREAIFGDTIVGRFLGTSDFVNIAKEATDIKTRLRTGAALNESEIKFYESQRPKFGDSPEDVNKKLTQLEGFYLGASGLPVIVTDDKGNAYEFDDLFNNKQRLGLREAINNGLKLSY